MVSEKAEVNFDTCLAERLEVNIALVEKSLYIRVVVEVNHVILGVVVDVGSKKDHCIEERSAVLENILKAVERVAVIHLDVNDILHLTCTLPEDSVVHAAGRLFDLCIVDVLNIERNEITGCIAEL